MVRYVWRARLYMYVCFSTSTGYLHLHHFTLKYFLLVFQSLTVCFKNYTTELAAQWREIATEEREKETGAGRGRERGSEAHRTRHLGRDDKFPWHALHSVIWQESVSNMLSFNFALAFKPSERERGRERKGDRQRMGGRDVRCQIWINGNKLLLLLLACGTICLSRHFNCWRGKKKRKMKFASFALHTFELHL